MYLVDDKVLFVEPGGYPGNELYSFIVFIDK